MTHFFHLFLVLQVLIVSINGEGYYSIIAPSIIRPYSEYQAAVSVHQSSEASTIKVGIISNTYSNFKVVEVKPFSTELIQFDIEDLKDDKYSLTAEGLTGIVFTNATSLKYQPKELSVLVQTDKSIYKPKDVIRYRVIILDSNLKPIANTAGSSVTINILDANENRIKHISEARLTNSIYSDEFEIAGFPAYGEWEIQVRAQNDRIYRKSFEIVEYVLPNFEVVIDSLKHAIYKDRTIPVTVKARYPFGKPIKGEVTVSIYPKFYGSIQPFIFNLITRKVVTIDGKAYVEFDIKDELKFKEDFQREIIVEAIVEEKSTGKKQNATTIVNIHRDQYDIEVVKIPRYFIPNVPFEVILKFTQHDGVPLRGGVSAGSAYLTRDYSSNEMYNKSDFLLNENGVVKLQFSIPDEVHKSDQYNVIVSYLDAQTDIGAIKRKYQRNNYYIQANVLTENPAINDEIIVEVKSSQPMKYFIYQIKGRGNILLSKTVYVNDLTDHVFKILSTFPMAPEAKLLVYYVENGDFIFDEQIIYFERKFLNHVKIDAPSKGQPGEDIDITVMAKPYSYLGLMAVDVNTDVLGPSNDVDMDLILEELDKYDSDDLYEQVTGSTGYFSKDKSLLTLSNTNDVSDLNDIVKPTFQTLINDADDGGKMTTIKKTDIGPAHKFEVNTRPPLAGPYAFSRIPKPLWNRPIINLMFDIKDTWFFVNVSSGPEGRISLRQKLPDERTSWLITGFSLDPVHGLGLPEESRIVHTFKPFYIATDLPPSIKIGEIISISFVIFNNLNDDQDVKVTMYNNAQEFEFVQINNQINSSAPKIELYSRKMLNVAGNSTSSVTFIIQPKKIGQIEIMASAMSPFATYTVKKNLQVILDGQTEYFTRGILIDLNSNSEQKENVKLNIPKNIISNSIRIEASVIGDILGPAIVNIGELIKLPSGYGEQNLANFVTTVDILNYLQKSGRISKDIIVKSSRLLTLGYQEILSHRLEDGSFSFSTIANDDDKSNGSTWLTAYVASSLEKANSYIQVESDLIKAALEYLAKMQVTNGSFIERSQQIAIDEFSIENDGGLALTAFTTLAFLENAQHFPDYRNEINRALDFISKGLYKTENLFSLAIGVYTLQAADHDARSNFIQTIDSKAFVENGTKWWMLPISQSEKRSPWYNNSRTLNILTSSFAALSYLEANLISDALPVIKWLVNQRNSQGGFMSSFDTVWGIKVLTKFAEKLPPSNNNNNNIQVAFKHSLTDEFRINVDPDNVIVPLMREVPVETREINITASGRGLAYVQIWYNYNVNVTGAWPRFNLDPQVNRISHSDYLHLSICTSFVPVPGEPLKSNMAVMEVNFPSGFIVDLNTIPSLESRERIQKVETKNENTLVIIYFDFLNQTEICPTIDAYKTYKVTNHKPVSVVIYDYYDNARKARLFYYAPKSTLCDICEGDSCSDSCRERAEERQALDGKNIGSIISIKSSLYLLFTISVLYISNYYFKTNFVAINYFL